MKLEDQVPDKVYCERLKELGMPQEMLFYWVEHGSLEWLVFQKDPDDLVNTHIAAPTVAELGEMLPAYLSEDAPPAAGFEEQKLDDGFWIRYPQEDDCDFLDLKEANARAKLLIWCAEMGYVKWEKVGA